MTRFAAAIVAAGLVTLPAAPVGAGPGSGGGGGGGGSADGVITAGVSFRGDRSPRPGGDCTWTRVEGEYEVPQFGSTRFPFVDDNGATVNLWQKLCPEDGGGWYLIPETRPQDLLPQLLEQVKSARLPKPEPTFLALDPVHRWAYVTVPLDFRASANSWRTVSATASIGPVWARVTAEPMRLTFDSGDPNGSGPVVCSGNAPVAGYDPAFPGECSHTYRNASSTSPYDGYHFLTTTTIDWSISWTSSSGAGGALDPFSTSASVPLAVAEVKGLVTCTGARAEQGGC